MKTTKKTKRFGWMLHVLEPAKNKDGKPGLMWKRVTVEPTRYLLQQYIEKHGLHGKKMHITGARLNMTPIAVPERKSKEELVKEFGKKL